jgi:hypothetical protein
VVARLARTRSPGSIALRGGKIAGERVVDEVTHEAADGARRRIMDAVD